jgi:hypothetical protein
MKPRAVASTTNAVAVGRHRVGSRLGTSVNGEEALGLALSPRPLRSVDVHRGAGAAASRLGRAEMVRVAVGQDDRAEIGRGAAQLCQRRTHPWPAARPAGVVQRDLPAVVDEIPVDDPVCYPVDAGPDRLSERHQAEGRAEG